MRPNEALRLSFCTSARGAFVLILLFGGCREKSEAVNTNNAQPTSEHAQEHARDVAQPSAEPPRHAEHDHSQHLLAATAPLADRSLYHLDARFTDQDGQNLELASLRGSAVLAAMFYASCQSVCPMLISQLARLEATLPDETRAQTQVLLVSLDPDRDSTPQLKQLAQRHSISNTRWHIVRTEADTVREMAALLGVRYRQLPNGDFSHSPTIVLLDREGVVTDRMENAADDPAALTAATTKLVRAN